MDTGYRDGFVRRWRMYFDDAELPMAVFYTDDERCGKVPRKGEFGRCVVEAFSAVRSGTPLLFHAGNIGCRGGAKYLGFTPEVEMRDFEHFLSCGIPGRMEGERYKKSPELVRESMKHMPDLQAPGEFIAFKRWDQLTDDDEPEIVVFFADQDVLSGLFTLANFDEAEPNGVICPFGSGCSSVVYHPYREIGSERPRCVIGMFDISARPFVGEDTLTFAVPIDKFRRMAEDMEESFLITDSWQRLRRSRRR